MILHFRKINTNRQLTVKLSIFEFCYRQIFEFRCCQISNLLTVKLQIFIPSPAVLGLK